MIDLGVEVFIMLLDLVKKLRLLIFYIFVVTMAGVIGVSKRFIRLYKDVFININKIIYKTVVWVIYWLEYGLILGQSFHK